ncbi:MAG TPA: hypothetical protein VKU19_38880 [Bryobacteraceae bacterium]|nr:hypothetical protein [Bryobacteraceae bacterium]
MRLTPLAAAILLFAGMPAHAHRLDEYLQGTLLSIEKNRVDAQMTLVPGVAVFAMLIADIDTDGNGAISESEARLYAGQVLRDLSLSIDGRRLMPHLVSVQVPGIEEMREGRGEIRIEFAADLPAGGATRKLTLENHHQSRIAAYQVNCLVPRDPDMRVNAQNRNYSQSLYELEFTQAGARADSWSLSWFSASPEPLGLVALLLVARFVFVWRRRARPLKLRDGNAPFKMV